MVGAGEPVQAGVAAQVGLRLAAVESSFLQAHQHAQLKLQGYIFPENLYHTDYYGMSRDVFPIL